MSTSEQLTVCKMGYAFCGFWFAFKSHFIFAFILFLYHIFKKLPKSLFTKVCFLETLDFKPKAQFRF